MSPEELRTRITSDEIKYSATRSGGPGGQNVNKVNTKVELRFNINSSSSLTYHEKQLLLNLLGKKINDEGDLLIISQSERSQLQNKKDAEEKFFRLLAKALTVKPERKATGPTKASKTKRLEKKRKRSGIKKLRKDSGISEEDI
jgi:ribosome-associated protein